MGKIRGCRPLEARGKNRTDGQDCRPLEERRQDQWAKFCGCRGKPGPKGNIFSTRPPYRASAPSGAADRTRRTATSAPATAGFPWTPRRTRPRARAAAPRATATSARSRPSRASRGSSCPARRARAPVRADSPSRPVLATFGPGRLFAARIRRRRGRGGRPRPRRGCSVEIESRRHRGLDVDPSEKDGRRRGDVGSSEKTGRRGAAAARGSIKGKRAGRARPPRS